MFAVSFKDVNFKILKYKLHTKRMLKIWKQQKEDLTKKQNITEVCNES